MHYFRKNDAVEAIQIPDTPEVSADVAAFIGRESPKWIEPKEDGGERKLCVQTPEGPSFPSAGYWLLKTNRPGIVRVVADESFSAEYVRYK